MRRSNKITNERIKKLDDFCERVDEVIKERTMSWYR